LYAKYRNAVVTTTEDRMELILICERAGLSKWDVADEFNNKH
jgi:hypothetical protein